MQHTLIILQPHLCSFWGHFVEIRVLGLVSNPVYCFLAETVAISQCATPARGIWDELSFLAQCSVWEHTYQSSPSFWTGCWMALVWKPFILVSVWTSFCNSNYIQLWIFMNNTLRESFRNKSGWIKIDRFCVLVHLPALKTRKRFDCQRHELMNKKVLMEPPGVKTPVTISRWFSC